jgi:tetratricopeptide (TPR) repeat protein
VIAAVGVVLAALSTATVVSVRQARRAEAEARRADEQAKRAQKRFDDVRRLANSLLFEIDDKIAGVAGTLEARELIARRALEYLDGLAEEAKDDPALARELATAYLRIGGLRNSDDPRGGLERVAKARRILDGVVASGHGDVPTRWALVRALLADADLRSQLDDFRAALESTLAARKLAAELPDDGTFDYPTMARAHMFLNYLAINLGEIDLAVGSAQACLDLLPRWSQRDPTERPLARGGFAYISRGGALAFGGDPDQAMGDVNRGAAILADLAARKPAVYGSSLTTVHQVTAASLSGIIDGTSWVPHVVDDLPRAEEAARAALAIAEREAQREPTQNWTSIDLVGTLDDLAMIITERDPREASQLLERALAVVARMPASARDVRQKKGYEGTSQCAMAVPLAKLGRRADALAASVAGIAMTEEEASVAGAGVLERLAPWMCRFQAARARRALGDDAAAADLLEQTAAGLRPVVAERPRAMLSYVGLVDTLGQLAALRPAQRCALLDEAASAWRSWPGTPTPYTRRRQAELDTARAACR